MQIRDLSLEVEQVFLHLPCSLWWMDRKHNYLGCNIETCAAFRAHSPDEILGKTVLEITKTKKLSELKAKAIYNVDERLMASGASEFQVKNMIPPHEDELSKFQLGAKQPIFNARKEVIGLMGVSVFDHEVNKGFQESLQHLSLNQFKVISHPTVHLGFKEAFDLMPCSLFWMDRAHFYLGGNLECCNIARVDPPHEIVGKTTSGIVAMNNWPHYKAKNLSDLDEFIMRTGLPSFGIEVILPRPNQLSIKLFATKKPIFNHKNEVIGLMGAGMYNGDFGVLKTQTTKSLFY